METTALVRGLVKLSTLIPGILAPDVVSHTYSHMSSKASHST